MVSMVVEVGEVELVGLAGNDVPLPLCVQAVFEGQASSPIYLAKMSVITIVGQRTY